MTQVPAMPAKQALCFGSSLNRESERIPRRLPRGGFNIFNSLPALPVPLF